MRRAVVVVAVGAALAGSGLALARTPGQQAVIDSTVRFLQARQGTDGGFAEPGDEASPGITGWVNLALAAAGINPQDQARCGETSWAFAIGHFQEGLEEEGAWPEATTTAFERELLVVDAAAGEPHAFAGHDLVGEILDRQLPDGSFPHVPGGEKGGANDTIFAILALSPVHEPEVAEAIAAAREWVVGAQSEATGGWYYSGKSAISEVDMTGAALEALVAAGPPAEEPALAAYRAAEEKGLEYLRGAQLPDGGFPALPASEAESNVASTAWAVQAIWATGGNPEAWVKDGREPLDYMESMQQEDGHIRWRASTDTNGIWMTAYVTPAFAGQALPIPAAARDPSPSEAADCLRVGTEEGHAPRPSEGVVAGGGGDGAPAFSRPKAKSKGRTPGGARLVRAQGLRAKDHSDRRRGANVNQARGTETVEPGSAAEADQEVEEVAPGPAGTSDGGSRGAGGEGPEHDRSGDGGAPGALGDPPRTASPSGGEEVSGVVIGSPDGDERGKLAFGAPGLRGAGAGAGAEPWTAIAIGAAALLAAALGFGWERRRGAVA
jgi:prenyltransferase beta subunit